jgi:hypothetical protein
LGAASRSPRASGVCVAVNLVSQPAGDVMDLDVGVLGVDRSRVKPRHTSVLPSASLARVQSNTQLVHARGTKHASRRAERRLGERGGPRGLTVASSNEACPSLDVARLNGVFVLVA